MKNDTGITGRSDASSLDGQQEILMEKCCGCSRNDVPVCISSTNFFILANNSHDGFFINDEHFNIVFMNASLKAYVNSTMKEWSWERECPTIHSARDLLHPDDWNLYIANCRSILCGKIKSSILEVRLHERYDVFQTALLLMESIVFKKRVMVLNVLRGNSRSPHEKNIYQGMVDAYPEIALVMDTKGCILALNQRLIEKVGKSYEEIIHEGIVSCIPKGMAIKRTAMLEKIISSGKTVSFTDCDEDYCTMEHFLAPIHNTKGDIEKIAIFCRDISQHIQAQETNRMLSRSLLSAIEAERKKIAYELHDQCGQLVMVVGLGLSAIREALPKGMGDLKSLCEKYLYIIENLGTLIKNISAELHPDLLDTLGLAPALSSYIETFFAGIPSVNHTFSCLIPEKSFGAKIDIVLYRVVQESLNNVIRHANARNVDIELIKKGDRLRLLVADDGIGFQNNYNMPEYKAKRIGLGLLSMKERVASVNGRFILKSFIAKGTKITVDIRIPMNGQKDVNP